MNLLPSMFQQQSGGSPTSGLPSTSTPQSLNLDPQFGADNQSSSGVSNALSNSLTGAGFLGDVAAGFAQAEDLLYLELQGPHDAVCSLKSVVLEVKTGGSVCIL